MGNSEHNSHAASGEATEAADTSEQVNAGESRDDFVATVATVAVVGVGVAALEVALLPGVVLGVAAVLAPKYLPKLGQALSPVFRSTVRGVYKVGKKTREMAAEAQEHVHDIVAEVHAEDEAKPATKNGADAPAAPAA